MLHALADMMIAGGLVLAGLLLGGRDTRHGREAAVMAAVCIICTIAGLAGVLG